MKSYKIKSKERPRSKKLTKIKSALNKMKLFLNLLIKNKYHK